jgi:hypothetical protein
MRLGYGIGGVLGLVAALALTVGCGPTDTKGERAENKPTAAEKKPDHSDWWCKEHGIPEKECSMCQDAVAKECKAKGDWCQLHDRAKSQCFYCDPSLKEKFTAKYRAKYGEDPPPITEEEEKKKAEKK